ncbi:VWA domain-containing protein [Nocardia sp. NPDC058633]|uniref:vWA domain-containing protein n=1 Tax=Nocardia sp. NPDC058633 TaxID=3346568 RepID=UPI00364CDC8A
MRFAKVIGLATAAAIGLLPSAVPAFAAPTDSTYAPTMLVLDASGSMLAADPGGGTKMDAAKTAVRGFVATAPTAAKVGLSVYGTGTGSTDAEKPAGCRDVSVLQPAETIDKPALTTAVDNITPSGFTPIGTALRTAADALPTEGPRSIVLVSVGLDTCAPPDPCEVARELSGQGADIVVHAIGFGVDDASRAQLTCIAETTGGTYTDAADGKALEQVLPRVSTAALRDYASAGTPVEGTQGYQDAPVVAPGQYLDTIGHKKPRYYAVDVPEGATAYFSGTVSFPHGESAERSNNSLYLRVYGAEGKDCNVFEHENAVRSTDGVALTVTSHWAGATEPKDGTARTDSCKGGGRYYFAAEWATVADNAPATLPLELNVAVEPGVSDAGPAAEPAPAPFVAPDGPVESVTGGGSFNVATALDGSGVYGDTMQRGEFVFYKVKLDWGQGLAYRVRFLETSGRGLDNVSVVTTTLYTPYRKEVAEEFTSYNGAPQTLPSNEQSLAIPEVRYRNRESSAPAVSANALAGWYYIAVKLSPTINDPGVVRPVPIELDLAVTGTSEPGPTYRTVPGSTGGSAEHAPDTARAADSDDDNSTALLVTGIAVVAFASVLGGVVVFTLLRKRGRR